MKKAEIKVIHKNSRYKVVSSGSKYYLIDVDSSWLGYIFFGLNWLIPQKGYILADYDADDLLVHRVEYRESKTNTLPSLTGVVVFFNFILPSLINRLYSDSALSYSQLRKFGDTVIAIPSIMHSVQLLLSISFAAFAIRIILSKQSKKNMLKKINYNNLPVVKIRFSPISLANIMKNLAVYISFALLTLMAGAFVVVLEGYWVVSLCFSSLLLFFLLTNHLSMSVGTYKIRKIKEK